MSKESIGKGMLKSRARKPLLLQRNSRLWKGDLKGIYDGTLFWMLQEENEKGRTGPGFGALEGLKVVERVGEGFWAGDGNRDLEIVFKKRQEKHTNLAQLTRDGKSNTERCC
jgi:hypothetical protein